MEIQNPSPSPFSARDLKWTAIYDLHSINKITRKAYIPWTRINDFIKGEWKIDGQSLHDEVWDLLQVFYSEFLDEYSFINYFRDEWQGKIDAYALTISLTQCQRCFMFYLNLVIVL